MSYSTDLRERVISFVESGGSKAEAARRFHVTRSTVYNWMRKPCPDKPGPKAPRLDVEKLMKHIERHGDMYLAERAEVFGLTPSGMWRAMNRLGLTLKKTWQFTEVSIQLRKAYLKKWYNLKDLPLVYLDETAFAPDALRTHGWATRDRRAYGRISGNRRPRTSLIGARHVIMDNAAFHKHPTTRKLIEDAGHTLLYLPPYSPDLNPIEHAWARIKAIRRLTGLSPEEIVCKII